jgi:hypothetical protein
VSSHENNTTLISSLKTKVEITTEEEDGGGVKAGIVKTLYEDLREKEVKSAKRWAWILMLLRPRPSRGLLYNCTW